ncbi:hypothetical protein ACFU8R_00055 [Pseudonocardia alni]|uniref:hypothetical protein n=1 Tax=Pseudonocardia alni TaxID=33907 RepID=UPI00331B5EA0
MSVGRLDPTRRSVMLVEHTAVREVVIVGAHHGRGADCVVPAKGPAVDPAGLSAGCHGGLAILEVTAKDQVIDALPIWKILGCEPTARIDPGDQGRVGVA